MNPIKRSALLFALQQSKKQNKKAIYSELLYIWYSLIEQESINNDFIYFFYFYGKISDEALNYYKQFVFK